jgi:iron complex transport system substrate-binding protein
MEKKYRLYFIAMAVITIVAVASAAGTLIYYQGKATTQKNGAVLATLVDDTGYVLNLTSYPKRIVSLAPGCTQILFAVGAGNNVVGVTDYDNYPYNFSAWEQAGNMTSIGNYYNPAVEPIVSLKPDLVIASEGSFDAANQLRNLGYNVLTINPKDLNGILADIVTVGRATGNEAQAASLASSLSHRIAAVVNAVANATTKPKVYHEIWSAPTMSAGQGTFINNLISLAGGQNIFENATTAYPTISSEEVITQNPDVIIFPSQMGVPSFWGNYSAVASRPGWNTISAVQNNRLYTINGDMIDEPGPRQVDALELIAQMLHPEIFGNYTGP